MKRKKFMQLILLSIALVFTCFIRSDDSSARRSALSKRGKNDVCSFSTTRIQGEGNKYQRSLLNSSIIKMKWVIEISYPFLSFSNIFVPL